MHSRLVWSSWLTQTSINNNSNSSKRQQQCHQHWHHHYDCHLLLHFPFSPSCAYALITPVLCDDGGWLTDWKINTHVRICVRLRCCCFSTWGFCLAKPSVLCWYYWNRLCNNWFNFYIFMSFTWITSGFFGFRNKKTAHTHISAEQYKEEAWNRVFDKMKNLLNCNALIMPSTPFRPFDARASFFCMFFCVCIIARWSAKRLITMVMVRTHFISLQNISARH